jgi:DNA-binding Lrp family transcriptional regulator
MIRIILLKILHNDSKLTVKELAAQVNLSPSVFERIRRMEKEGYIKKYIAVLDAEN